MVAVPNLQTATSALALGSQSQKAVEAGDTHVVLPSRGVRWAPLHWTLGSQARLTSQNPLQGHTRLWSMGFQTSHSETAGFSCYLVKLG